MQSSAQELTIGYHFTVGLRSGEKSLIAEIAVISRPEVEIHVLVGLEISWLKNLEDAEDRFCHYGVQFVDRDSRDSLDVIGVDILQLQARAKFILKLALKVEADLQAS